MSHSSPKKPRKKPGFVSPLQILARNHNWAIGNMNRFAANIPGVFHHLASRESVQWLLRGERERRNSVYRGSMRLLQALQMGDVTIETALQNPFVANALLEAQRASHDYACKPFEDYLTAWRERATGRAEP